MIEYIKNLIEGSFSENIEVDLASLIWTVDAKEHCIPNPKEINDALRHIKNYKIIRDENGIKIASNVIASHEEISNKDIDKAMEIYKQTIKGSNDL